MNINEPWSLHFSAAAYACELPQKIKTKLSPAVVTYCIAGYFRGEKLRMTVF